MSEHDYHQARSKYRGAREYLASREREEVIAAMRAHNDVALPESKSWMAEYLARPKITGKNTRFNWSPRYSITIAPTATEEPTSDQETHHKDQGQEAPAVGAREGVGDAPGEEGAAGESGGSAASGNVEAGQRDAGRCGNFDVPF